MYSCIYLFMHISDIVYLTQLLQCRLDPARKATSAAENKTHAWIVRSWLSATRPCESAMTLHIGWHQQHACTESPPPFTPCRPKQRQTCQRHSRISCEQNDDVWKLCRICLNVKKERFATHCALSWAAQRQQQGHPFSNSVAKSNAHASQQQTPIVSKH